MPKKRNKNNKTTLIVLGAIACIVIYCIVYAVLPKEQPQSDEAKESEAKTKEVAAIDEAQLKCMLMEESDLVNYMGESFGEETTKKAREFCLSQWDLSKSPENTEESFIEIITSDWEIRKDEVLEGHTLQELYDASPKY